MKALLFAAGLLGLLTAVQAQTSPAILKHPRKTKYDPQVYEVTNNGIKMSLSYLDPVECAMKLEKDAELSRWSVVQRAEEKAKLPAGGYLRATWSRESPLLASAYNFAFLVETADGKELQRWKPEPSISTPLSLMGITVYTDFALVPLPAPLPDGAHVFVIEPSAGKRFEYLIHP